MAPKGCILAKNCVSGLEMANFQEQTRQKNKAHLLTTRQTVVVCTIQVRGQPGTA
jgi:hypothetical protein